MKFDLAEQCFLELYRSALWNTPLQEDLFDDRADWKRIVELAREQTVIGLITDSISKLPQERQPSKKLFFSLLAQAYRIENTNKEMNMVLPKLFLTMRQLNVNGWLQKGQGVARNYINPNLRQSGDVDLMIADKEEYQKMTRWFAAHFKEDKGERDEDGMHSAFNCDGILVELHGKVVAHLNKKTNARFEDWQKEVLTLEQTVIWEMNGGEVRLLPVRYDAIYIALHMFRHYIDGGIGLRQVADWMRFLYVHREDLAQMDIGKDIDRLGLTKLWEVFGSMCVDLLGCPEDCMPHLQTRYPDYAKSVLRYILDSGNFGHSDKRAQSDSNYKIIRTCTVFYGHMLMKLRNWKMFPAETWYGLPYYFKDIRKRMFEKK